MSNNHLLQPSIVFDCFAEVNKVPRPSKREEKMIAFLKAFGEGLGLDSIDALELGMAIKKAFGVTFSQIPADNKAIFRSVKTLADFVQQQKKDL